MFPQAETSRTAATRIATQYSYTFWTGTDTIQTMTTTYPTVSSSENGSGNPTSAVNYYDNRGRLRWQKDPLGYVTYYSYHPQNGQLAYTVRDADPNSLPSSADSQFHEVGDVVRRFGLQQQADPWRRTCPRRSSR